MLGARPSNSPLSLGVGTKGTSPVVMIGGIIAAAPVYAAGASSRIGSSGGACGLPLPGYMPLRLAMLACWRLLPLRPAFAGVSFCAVRSGYKPPLNGNSPP